MTFCLLGSGVWGLNQKLFTYTEILVEFPPPHLPSAADERLFICCAQKQPDILGTAQT